MTRAPSTLRRIDDAIARFEEALDALWQIPKEGHGVPSTVSSTSSSLLQNSCNRCAMRWPATAIGPSEAAAQHVGQRQILSRVADAGSAVSANPVLGREGVAAPGA